MREGRKSEFISEEQARQGVAIWNLPAVWLNKEVQKTLRILLVSLSILGVVVSALALQVHYSNKLEPCDINERWDCGIVNHSSYSSIHGAPVAAIGIAGYLLICLL